MAGETFCHPRLVDGVVGQDETMDVQVGRKVSFRSSCPFA